MTPLREAIARATRREEPACVQALLPEATFTAPQRTRVQDTASSLARRLRERGPGSGREGLVQAMMQEFSLSSHEGIALMCLAEALLRIPDEATRDALIRDKVADVDWASHLGHSTSMFVNAATWGLLLTGKLIGTHGETGLTAALRRVAAKGGEPLIRKSVDVAMRLLGEQFVIGETIDAALVHARRHEALGFRHSYDMLGEAALTAEDALRYLKAYEDAIHAIAGIAQGSALHDGPGISIKLSALHPRYQRSQYARVMDELYPRLLGLATLACRYGVGLNIDAEEADRLDISLDLLERLCHEPALQGWHGIGFVVQAYQKRCPLLIDWLIDVARRTGHRLMIRLVKGAYWDSEIKRAQIEGLADYPVYTRKVHTDMAYLACARRLLAAPAEVFPQFATHNAHTVAAICEMAGPDFQLGQYEFQCLHGMGEPLYEMVVASPETGGLGRPCRIYAPVGTHETLLAYLVRRLLENGANTSFVHRLADAQVPLEELLADPVETIQRHARSEGRLGAPHPSIPLPADLYGDARRNARGCDLNDDITLAHLQAQLAHLASRPFHGLPLVAHPLEHGNSHQPVRNPAHHADVIGTIRNASLHDVAQAAMTSAAYAATWRRFSVSERAGMLEHAAELMTQRMPHFIHLLVREAGKTLPNAIGEVREAIDHLRYSAAQIQNDLRDRRHQPLGTVVCISPWNFPLAIFTGQIAAALAAGNTVLAKPAEQTPLIATLAAATLHEAGVPLAALQTLPGPGETIGEALVMHEAVRGVMFTGSTAVAKRLQGALAGRLNERNQPIPLIAETGGQNAMIVDSSALPEQVVQDVIASAFDSAGQRCSALRVLCLQEEIADRVMQMLEGAMAELRIGPPDSLHCDVGPLIDEAALRSIESHLDDMRERGHRMFQPPLACVDESSRDGCFMLPTLLELDAISQLKHEVFGPVLHVVRYPREGLARLIDDIHATGYGLTLGIHSRIDETIEYIVARARIGNIYVNRNMIGAVVGVQPFGGEGDSGTGPKAGGPLYLHRLLAPDENTIESARGWKRLAEQARVNQPLQDLAHLKDWLATGRPIANVAALREHAEWLMAHSPAGCDIDLAGPTGERNRYLLHARQNVLCLARDQGDLIYQLATVLAVDAQAVWIDSWWIRPLVAQLPDALRSRIRLVGDMGDVDWDAVLMNGAATDIIEMAEYLAERPGRIVTMQAAPKAWRHLGAFSLVPLLREQMVSMNTAAAGGNASLMTLGES